MHRVDEISMLKARLQRVVRGMRAVEQVKDAECEVQAAYECSDLRDLGQLLLNRNTARVELETAWAALEDGDLDEY